MSDVKVTDRISEMIEAVNAAPFRDMPAMFASNESLIEDCIRMARNYYLEQEREPSDEMQPTWHLLSGNNQTALIVTPFIGPDENVKDLVAMTIRKFISETHVKRYAFMSEAWLATSSKEQWKNNKLPPSQRSDRVEVIIIMAQGRDDEGLMKAFEIVRDWETGKVTDLKPYQTDMPGSNRVGGGRFANLYDDPDNESIDQMIARLEADDAQGN